MMVKPEIRSKEQIRQDTATLQGIANVLIADGIGAVVEVFTSESDASDTAYYKSGNGAEVSEAIKDKFASWTHIPKNDPDVRIAEGLTEGLILIGAAFKAVQSKDVFTSKEPSTVAGDSVKYNAQKIDTKPKQNVDATTPKAATQTLDEKSPTASLAKNGKDKQYSWTRDPNGSAQHALDRHSPNVPEGANGKGTLFPSEWTDEQFLTAVETAANAKDTVFTPARDGVGFVAEVKITINNVERTVRIIVDKPDPNITGTGPGAITSAYTPHKNM